MKSSTPSNTIRFILCLGILMLLNSELYNLVLCSFTQIIWIMKFFCTDSIFFLIVPRSLGDLNSPTRDQTSALSSESVES